jgi:hypothetical protein
MPGGALRRVWWVAADNTCFPSVAVRLFCSLRALTSAAWRCCAMAALVGFAIALRSAGLTCFILKVAVGVQLSAGNNHYDSNHIQ